MGIINEGNANFEGMVRHVGRRLSAYRNMLSRALRRRSFLIRLLASTLLAAFVPLTIMAVQLINRESNNVRKSAQAQLESVGRSVVGQVEDMITGMNSVNVKLMLSAKLYDSVLSSSVQSEIEALEIIDYYGEAMPFVKNYALYSCAEQEAYSLLGKMYLNAFSRFVLNLSEEDFLALLNDRRDAGFVPWAQSGGNMLYIAPIRTGGNVNTSRYGIYIISPVTLLDTMRTILAGRYNIAAIYDKNGQLVYQETGVAPEMLDLQDGAFLCTTQTSSLGYSAQVYMDKSVFQQNVESITHNARLLSMLNIVLCVLLIIMVVFFNYRPLAQVVRRVRGEGESSDQSAPELDSILTSYTHLIAEKGNLTYQLYEKNMLLADRTMENLLSGRKVPPDDLRLLKLNMPCYRVVCAPLNLLRNVSAIIEHNAIGSPIYAIEMYADGKLAFVCGCTDATNAALRPLSEALRTLLGSQDIPLGYSTAYETPDRLFMAYLEAGRALHGESETPDRLSTHAMGSQIYILDENPQVIEKLTCALKTGDEYLLLFAEKSLDEILAHSSSRASQRYGCYQLIELYRRLAEAVGMALDMEQLSQILQESSIASIKERTLSILSQARETRLRDLSQAADVTYSSIMQYIGDNFANPLFSLSDVADHLGVSIYTASRVLKTLTGINFRKYLNDIRVEYAKDLLLTTDLPVVKVSEQAGFTSPSYFIKIFKEAENTTPSNYRSQHSAEE